MPRIHSFADRIVCIHDQVVAINLDILAEIGVSQTAGGQGLRPLQINHIKPAPLGMDTNFHQPVR
jgi:hypothetical protein